MEKGEEHRSFFPFNLSQYHETVPRENHKDAGNVDFRTIKITVRLKTWEKVSLPKSLRTERGREADHRNGH